MLQERRLVRGSHRHELHAVLLRVPVDDVLSQAVAELHACTVGRLCVQQYGPSCSLFDVGCCHKEQMPVSGVGV